MFSIGIWVSTIGRWRAAARGHPRSPFFFIGAFSTGQGRYTRHQQPNLFGFSRFDRLTVSSTVRLELLTGSRITRSHKISVNFDTRDSGHTHLTPGTLWIMSFEIPLLFRLRFEHVKFKSKRLCALLTRSATFFKRKYFETYLFLRVALSNVVILINSYVNIYRSSFYIYLWPFTVLFYVLHTAQPPI